MPRRPMGNTPSMRASLRCRSSSQDNDSRSSDTGLACGSSTLNHVFCPRDAGVGELSSDAKNRNIDARVLTQATLEFVRIQPACGVLEDAAFEIAQSRACQGQKQIVVLSRTQFLAARATANRET